MDIVERLRGGTIGVWPDDDGPTEALMAEAADEIERLMDRLYLYDCWCQVKNVTPTTEDLNEMARIFWPRALKESE